MQPDTIFNGGNSEVKKMNRIGSSLLLHPSLSTHPQVEEALRAMSILNVDDGSYVVITGLSEALSKFDPTRNTTFESYSRQVLKWRATDELRRQYRQPAPTVPIDENLDAAAPEQRKDLEAAERKALAKALLSLSKANRTLIYLRFLRDLDFEAIRRHPKFAKVKRGTLRTRCCRALKLLRDELPEFMNPLN